LAPLRLRPATGNDADGISRLILSLSRSFTVSADGSGAEKFHASIGEPAIRRCVTAENFLYVVAEAQSQLVGVAAVRDRRHLHHLFVAPAFQGRGLGRLLWSTVRDGALMAGAPREFTVNSSPDAVAVYERFGFVAAGSRSEVHGIAFIPMRLAADAVDR